ncbi:hypothetical protein [Novosphingobium sp. PhB57]|uniref:hypothetical protein n=1 Tax=Novosphingobium sp. PhB57 TaxID=2485107 RepID=UPI0010461060|nr:hypothetical protein [Novosphingobium sp. PhB57]
MIAALAGAISAAPAMAAAPACPGRSFNTFLAAFAANADIQRAHVADPLSSGRIDAETEPEPRMVTSSLPKAALGFPIMPLGAERRRDGLEMRTAPKGGGKFEVVLAKPDTGYQLRYQFQPVGDCWQLSAMTDESM